MLKKKHQKLKEREKYATSSTFSLSDSTTRGHKDCALTYFNMRPRIQQSRPKSLNDAVWLVVEIEAFSKAERQRRYVGFPWAAHGKLNETIRNRYIKGMEKFKTITRWATCFTTTPWEQNNQPLFQNRESVRQLKAEESRSVQSYSQTKFPFKCHNCGKRGYV